MTESKWNTKFSKLLVLAFLLILLPIVNATTFGYNYLDNQPSGNITNEYINNTYINQTGLINDSYYLASNPYGFYNITTLPETNLSNYYNKTTSDDRFCFANGTNSQGLECGENLPYNGITYVSPINGSVYINELPIFNATINESYVFAGMSFNGVDGYADLIRNVNEYNQGLNNWSIFFLLSDGISIVYGSVQYFYYYSDIQSLADATEEHNLKSTWLEDIKDWILETAETLFYTKSEVYNKTEVDDRYSNNTGDQDLSNYYNKTSNLNAVGYNVTADYYYGNASFMTGIPSPDLSGYFLLDQTTPQTISNGAPIFSKGLNVNADNEKIIMGNGNDSEEYFDGSNQIHKTAGYHYFYTNAVNYPVTIGTNSGVNKIVSTIPLSIMSAKTPAGVDTGFALSSSSDLIDFYTGGSVKLKLGALSGNTAFYPNADQGLSLGGTTRRFYNGFFSNSISNYADNSKHYFGAGNDFYITYDGTNAIFNTNAVGSGLAYFSNNVSATGYITRTTIYDKDKGNALDWVKDSSQLKEAKGIDHTQFYGYTKYNVTDYSKPSIKEICKEVENEKGLLITECENQTTYGTKEEEGVLLDEEIAMLTQAVYELKQQNQFLQEQINNLTGKDIKLEEANTRQDSALCSIKLFSWCLIK